MSAGTCCGARPPEYPGVRAEDIPEVSRLLVDLTAPGATHRSFRCRDCGQSWEEHRALTPGGTVFRVMKVGFAAEPEPAAQAQAAPAAPDLVVTSSRREGARALLTLAAAAILFYGLWRLPPLAAASYGWLARWIVGGILAVFVVQGAFSYLRSRRKAGRG